MEDKATLRKNEQPESTLSSGRSGLYEFDFEDINVEGVEEDSRKKTASSGNQEEKPGTKSDRVAGEENSSAAVLTESDEESEDPAEKARLAKLTKVRGFRSGWRSSVGFLTWIKDLAVVMVIIWLILSVAGFVKVEDNNCEPTLSAGEHVLVIKFSYKLTDPARGELVAVKNTASSEVDPSDKGVFFARIIGLPGDKIYINASGQIYVNDIQLVTSYCDGTTGYIIGGMSYPYTVPEDTYFVLSDNPNSTMDSRYRTIGGVAREDISGKVFGCYWPRESWRPIY